MIYTVVTRFRNSLVLVLDPEQGSLPGAMDGLPIAVSSSGLAVGTLSEFDGDTTVTLAMTPERPDEPGLVVRWSGELLTGGRIGILNIDQEVLVESRCARVINVTVMTNDSSEPDLIWVAVV